MALQAHLEVRPRSTGEILDDAWRLYLSDLPLLLALSGLFLLPAAGVVLLLLTQPIDAEGGTVLWPILAAVLLPLTGLGAGACQEAFHCWAEEHPPRLGECLAAAARRGLNHVAAQALMLVLPFCAAVWLVIPGLPADAGGFLAVVFLLVFVPVWMSGLGRQTALAAGQKNLWRAWRHAARASGRHPQRALVVVACRVALLGLAVLNLHLFARFALWAAEDLGGFDVALARLLCSLGNVPYVVVLFALAWWLLAPYAEAVNYLFFMDARTRYEGLDLWYRVEELFPVSESRPLPMPESKKYTPTRLAALLAVLALTAADAHADDRVGAVRAARKEIDTVRREVKAAQPYPGGQRWLGPLHRVGARLEGQGKGGYRWYRQAVAGFAERDRVSAAQQLERIEGRLALIEESLSRPPEEQGLTRQQIKALVSPRTRPDRDKVKGAAEKDRPEDRKDEKKLKRDLDDLGKGRGRVGGGMIGPVAAGGAGTLLLWLLLALVIAALVVGLVLLVVQWQRTRRAMPRLQTTSGPAAEDDLGDEPVQQDPASLWRRADELARAGDFLGAVRSLYLSVLALLHQGGLIRYERTRTNGEYADQLRRVPPLHGPFCRLTGLFELKWYGERACREADYRACRGLAEELRQGDVQRE